MVSRRIEHVHARPGEEVPPEDEYSWRKYGQKHILGAKYPREYYRCARSSRSSYCAATKMVQRSETGPSVFEVTYGGNHSCGQESKNQNEELLAVQTKCDEVERAAGEISESNICEMVSTPNNPFNNTSPLPDTDIPLDDDSLIVLFDDVPEYATSSADLISRNADWNLQLDNLTTLFDDDVPHENDKYCT